MKTQNGRVKKSSESDNPRLERRCAITQKPNRMRWLVDDFDYRTGESEVRFGPEVFFQDRDIAESNEMFDIRCEDGRIKKLLVKRPLENLSHPLQDLEDPDEEEMDEDAMARREVGLPHEQWDLVRWVEPRRNFIKLPENEYGERETVLDRTQPIVMVEMSAPWYPSRRWNRCLQDTQSIQKSHGLIAAMKRGYLSNGRAVWKEVEDLQPEDRRAVWYHWRKRRACNAISSFLRSLV